MKDNPIGGLLKINKRIFPYLISISFLVIALESYKYLGVLRKYIFVDSRFFLICSLISIMLLWYSKYIYPNLKPNIYEKITINTSLLLFPVSFILYEVMVVFDQFKYANYVYSAFHVQPQNFLYFVYLSLALFIPRIFDILKINIHSGAKNTKNTLLILILCSLIVIFFTTNFVKTLNSSIIDLIFIYSHRNYSYDQKMQSKWGIMYSVITLVKNDTPQDASIIFPPMSAPHSVDGRLEYFRSFLGGRKLVNYYDGINIDDFDYIVLAKGYLHGVYDGPPVANYIWPDFTVTADRIYIIEITKDFSFEKKVLFSSYDPAIYKDKNVWGLIRIKK